VAEVFYLGLALDGRYEKGFVEGCPERGSGGTKFRTKTVF
jgi:hypothetical protein